MKRNPALTEGEAWSLGNKVRPEDNLWPNHCLWKSMSVLTQEQMSAPPLLTFIWQDFGLSTRVGVSKSQPMRKFSQVASEETI